MRYLAKAILILLLVGPILVWAEEKPSKPLKNLGFIPANIWFSKDPFFAGDKIRIYTVVFNNSDKDLAATVELYDHASPIGKSVFSVARGGRVRDIWIDWTAVKGEHKIAAKIINAKLSSPAGEEVITLENSQTIETIRFADSDTDGDEIGDLNDDDDDNDGMTDAAELAHGTDPLKKEDIPPNPQQTEPGQAGAGQNVFWQDGFLQNTASNTMAATKTITERINALADRTRDKLETRREAVKREIAELNKPKESISTSSPKDTIAEKDAPKAAKLQSPLKYLTLALLSAAIFVLKYKLALYAVLIFIAYLFVSRILCRLRRR